MTSNNTHCDCNPIHEDAVKQLKQNMLSDEYVSKLSSFFKTLSDDTRVRIMYILSTHELCVSDIAVILNMTKSAVSHQLKALKYAGQVKSRREGKNVYYSLDDEHVVDIMDKTIMHIQHKK